MRPLAHDGKKNSYMSADPGWGQRVLVACVDGELYDVQFNLVRRVRLQDLASYIANPNNIASHPQDVLQCLETIARTTPMRIQLYTRKGFMSMLDDRQSRGELMGSGGRVDILP